MSTIFVDSSALVKRYIDEAGSTWINSLFEQTKDNTIVVAEITRVEVAAAIASRHRASKGISREQRDAMFRVLTLHFVEEYQIIPINPTVIDNAARLTQIYRLRGYDAVQLAAAILLAQAIESFTFLSADSDLNSAAKSEGLNTDNPNLHT